jgi:hypothetical protein
VNLRFAHAAAIANLLAAPSILGGTDYTAFGSAPGYVTFVAQVAMVIWFLIASISMLRNPQSTVVAAEHGD